MSIDNFKLRGGRNLKNIFNEIMANPPRVKFGYCKKLAIIDVDPQIAYTQVSRFKPIYDTNPHPRANDGGLIESSDTPSGSGEPQ